MSALRDLARALGGEVAGGQVVAPGPGHGHRDRSLSVRLSASSQDGFLCHSFAGDSFQACRDHVKSCIGLGLDSWKRNQPPRPMPAPAAADDDGRAKGIAGAVDLWRACADPRGTLAEAYFRSRALEVGADIAGDVIRWHSGIGAFVALFRSIATGEPQAASRTYLDREARKIERKFLGPVRGAAIMLDPFASVTHGLHIGEGIETCMAARQLGLRPTWALGSAGAIGSFPILGGIECLTFLTEHDDASANAVEACGQRWLEAGREAIICRSKIGSDHNDILTRGLFDGRSLQAVGTSHGR